MNAALTKRVTLLEQAFSEIARTRMEGVAVLHAQVRVQALEFIELTPEVALGVLITPWFMNLVRLPLLRLELGTVAAVKVGDKSLHELGALSVEFTHAFEPTVGMFECCSLFSPVTMFHDQAAIVATGREVMRSLVGAQLGTEVTAPAPPKLSRRSMFFGRGQGAP